jgi:hypothetical protein
MEQGKSKVHDNGGRALSSSALTSFLHISMLQ